MFQLNILSGKQAGRQVVARRFPFQLGRAGSADLVLPEPGVWERHARIELRPGEGFFLEAEGEALVAVNAQGARSALLRNGDLLDLGGAKLQFWLAEPRRADSRWRAAFIWAGIAAFFALQVAVLVRFLR